MSTDSLPKSKVESFINASVNAPNSVSELLAQTPELKSAKYVNGETALHYLAVEAYPEAVRLLCESGFDPNLPNDFGDSPLVDVAVLGNFEIAEILLEFGSDPNATSTTRDNVLACAVSSGNERLVELLLNAGADPNYKTDLDESIWDALPEEPEQRQKVETLLRKFGVSR